LHHFSFLKLDHIAALTESLGVDRSLRMVASGH